VIDCNEWKTEKHHECTNMGKVKHLNYDGSCTSHDFQFGTLEISGRLIFVEQRVPCVLLHCGEIYFTALNLAYSAYVEDSEFVSL